MSTINVQAVRSAENSVNYVLFGNDKNYREQLRSAGMTRAAAIALSMKNGSANPAEFVAQAERFARALSRKNELYSYVLAFHPDEFDVTNQADLDKICDVAVKLVERMHSADYLVVVHADAVGGHGHAHILVTNHDNLTGKCLRRYTSWKKGLHQLNDELMREEGLRVLPDPEEPKPGWEQRRDAFAVGGFEQTLGDKVYAALTDARSVDQTAFEAVLGEQGVTLAITDRDGWTYKMRRNDNGRIGRKKASTLTPDFMAETAHQLFALHAQNTVAQSLTTDHHMDTPLPNKRQKKTPTKQLTPARERYLSRERGERQLGG